MSAKMAYPVLLKIRILWNKGYYAIYSVYDVIDKILSHNSNYIVNVVIWPKFGNSSICKRDVIITSTSYRFDQKTFFLKGWSWFKFINLRLALGTNLKFYTSLSKELKLKVRKFWGLIPTFVEVTGKKLVEVGLFALPPHPE